MYSDPGEESEEAEEVSTIIVDEAVDPVRDIGVCESEDDVEEEEDFRSGRERARRLLPVLSWT